MDTTPNELRSDRSVLWEESFLIVFFRMIRTLRIYPDNSRSTKVCVSQLMEVMNKLLGAGDLIFQVSDFRFYVQGKRLRYHKEIVRIHSDIFEFMSRRKLKGLVLRPSPQTLSPGPLILFLRCLIQSSEHENPPDRLAQELSQANIDWVEILPLCEQEGEEPKVDNKERAKRIYWQTQGSLREVARQLRSEGGVGARRIKRLVQEMVDVASENEAILLATSTLRDFDDYTYVHSLNVAVLSIALGNFIGVSRNPLVYLGICALFHDLGKLEVPKEILKKSSRLTAAELEEIHKHPLASVRLIMKLRLPRAVKAELLLAPFEHHVHYDFSGYPKTHFFDRVSLFGRIVQIADFYDAVTSHRAYRTRSLPPPEALRLLVHGAGKQFDPLLVKAFVSMVGPYPAGTLLQLDTGEMGLVVDYPRDFHRRLPRVMLIERPAGGVPRGGQIVDLEDKDPQRGRPLRNVSRWLDAETHGVRPAEFLM